ncbi:O-antigen ligase family protein [Bacillus sp. JJ634]
MRTLEVVPKENVKIITWLLAFYLLLAPLDFLPVIPGVSLSRVLVFIPLIGFFLYLKDIKMRLDRFFVVPVVYVMLTMLTIFFSYDPSSTMQRIITIGMNIGVILVLSMLSYNKKEINILIRAMLYSGWVTLLLMVLFQDTDILQGRMTIIVNGAYQDPNYLTGFLLFSILYYFDDFINNKQKKSIIKMSIFLIFVLLTGSRGGMLGALGAILFYILIWIKSNRMKLSSIFTIISLILISVIFVILAGDILPEDMRERYTVSSVEESGGSGRTDLWDTTLQRYGEFSAFNKLFGGGAGTTPYFTYGHSSHNIWIDSLIEMGLVGSFILFF